MAGEHTEDEEGEGEKKIHGTKKIMYEESI